VQSDLRSYLIVIKDGIYRENQVSNSLGTLYVNLLITVSDWMQSKEQAH